MNETVFIGLGSNLGNSANTLTQALNALSTLALTPVVASSFYLSRPLGPADQNDYLNAVARITTDQPPLTLLDHLQAIENQYGRERKGERWGPRTLDLDILLYGDKAIDLPRLKVPHYHMMQRNFVLLPLYEIAPDLHFPDGQSLSDALQQLSLDGIKKLT
ncbi:MAG: 2-amino-4-hydroxy-6-hydroxymethyldihydropteridine diphosphokinase [Gammaproteobacteria bacterium]|nr:2-amino-4-hydroxy-6-hydroxymethyldihydropteridine diphosphokinase [Gammaproteobacteria bacterium]NVK87148.1 2-amino-4-hydroxy-6-hydroxymethyldihydropteridine diphosphokinase [Gammaproteobacteria bacterium]